MKDIYQSAYSVLVWLGSESDGNNEALDAMVQQFCLHEEIFSDSKKSISETQYKLWLQNMPWTQILALCAREYWYRLWIIQELAFNRHMTLFMCGEKQLSREMIQATITADPLWDLYASIKDNFKEISLGSTRKAIPSQESSYILLKRVIILLGLNWKGPGTSEADFATILDTGQTARCKDPRDKVYGLLGLFPDNIRKEMYPDKISTEELYTNFARVILSQEGLTRLLSWSFSPKEKTLPSWTPDWTTKFPRNHVQWLISRNACKSL